MQNIANIKEKNRKVNIITADKVREESCTELKANYGKNLTGN